MEFDVPLFRRQFPEFADTVKYPAAMITLWSTFATAQVNPNVWGTQANLGISLYTAHECVLAAQNVTSSQVGGSPGQQGGIAQTKTIGSVTVGYECSDIE